ncbi:MAG: DUF4258 domain-containing protein [Planctomycetes bacterium]|nr:DUF4258 domain-containing protein [Planctomycetota bacterium]
MAEYQFSRHARDMMRERRIEVDWIALTLDDPEREEEKDDGTIHYVRSIKDRDGRYLRVLVNPHTKPRKVITAFFDRSLGRKT